MSAVITIVSGRIDRERRAEVIEAYTAAIADGLTPDLEATFLGGDDESLSVITVWRSRGHLDAYIASVDEPLARRIIREAGGTPEVRILDVIARA
jgi:hypothetical protein